MNSENLKFDVAYTSILQRACDSLDIILREIKQPELPVIQAWELNERHYGALTGYNKAEMAAKYGNEQVRLWYTFLKKEWELVLHGQAFCALSMKSKINTQCTGAH